MKRLLLALLLALLATTALASPAGRLKLRASVTGPHAPILVAGANPGGSGWSSGWVSVPQNGDSTSFVYGYNAVMGWDEVPWQVISTPQQACMLAWHTPSDAEYGLGTKSNVTEVDAYTDNGVSVPIQSQTLSNKTGGQEWCANITSALPDGYHETREVGVASTGKGLIMQGTPDGSVPTDYWSLFFTTNFGGSLSYQTEWVSPNSGSDGNPCTQLSPCQTVYHAFQQLSTDQGGDCGGGTVYIMDAGTFTLTAPNPPTTCTAAKVWATLTIAPGLNFGDVTITGPSTSATGDLGVTKLHLKDLIVSRYRPFGTSTKAIWYEHVLYNGTQNTVDEPSSGWGTQFWTESTYSNATNGPASAKVMLVRNSITSGLSADTYSNSHVISYSVDQNHMWSPLSCNNSPFGNLNTNNLASPPSLALGSQTLSLVTSGLPYPIGSTVAVLGSPSTSNFTFATVTAYDGATSLTVNNYSLSGSGAAVKVSNGSCSHPDFYQPQGSGTLVNRMIWRTSAQWTNSPTFATSGSTLTFGTGAKSLTLDNLTVNAGKTFTPGQAIRLTYGLFPADHMDGTVSTFDGVHALAVNITGVTNPDALTSVYGWYVQVPGTAAWSPIQSQGVLDDGSPILQDSAFIDTQFDNTGASNFASEQGLSLQGAAGAPYKNVAFASSGLSGSSATVWQGGGKTLHTDLGFTADGLIWQDVTLASCPAGAGPPAIQSVTVANPGVLKIVGHGAIVGTSILIKQATGMTGINGTWVVQSVVDADHIQIANPGTPSTPLDTSGFPAYNASSGELEMNLSAVTKANPAIATVTGHPFSVGDVVTPVNVTGMTQINTKIYQVCSPITANSFALCDVTTGLGIDSSAFGTFTTTNSPVMEWQIPSGVYFRNSPGGATKCK